MDSLRELELQSVSSPKMDGMPKGSGSGDASAQHMIHVEYARNRVKRAKDALQKARRNALRVCRKMEGHMRKFCEAFYVEGFPFDVARVMSGVGERQCYRYVGEVEKITPEDGTGSRRPLLGDAGVSPGQE